MWGPVTMMKHWIWKLSTGEDFKKKKKKEWGDFKEKAAIIYPEKMLGIPYAFKHTSYRKQPSDHQVTLHCIILNTQIVWAFHCV